MRGRFGLRGFRLGLAIALAAASGRLAAGNGGPDFE
jgi:hypothetical protein